MVERLPRLAGSQRTESRKCRPVVQDRADTGAVDRC